MTPARRWLFRALSLSLRAALLGLWIALGAGRPASAQGGAVVRADPAVFQVGAGQVETLTIVLEDAQDAYGIDVRARFDPAVVEVVDADPARDGVQVIPGDFLRPDFRVRDTADNAAGTLQYVITQVNPTEPASGRGVVFSIMVRGKVEGARTAFIIDFVEIADRRGNLLPVTGAETAIEVVAPRPATPTPAPTAAAVAALAPEAEAVVAASGGAPAAPAAVYGPAPEPGLEAAAAPVAQSAPGLSTETALVIAAASSFAGAAALLGAAALMLWRLPARPE